MEQLERVQHSYRARIWKIHQAVHHMVEKIVQDRLHLIALSCTEKKQEETPTTTLRKHLANIRSSLIANVILPFIDKLGFLDIPPCISH